MTLLLGLLHVPHTRGDEPTITKGGQPLPCMFPTHVGMNRRDLADMPVHKLRRSLHGERGLKHQDGEHRPRRSDEARAIPPTPLNDGGCAESRGVRRMPNARRLRRVAVPDSTQGLDQRRVHRQSHLFCIGPGSAIGHGHIPDHPLGFHAYGSGRMPGERAQEDTRGKCVANQRAMRVNFDDLFPLPLRLISVTTPDRPCARLRWSFR